jgi:hypothetical protein
MQASEDRLSFLRGQETIESIPFNSGSNEPKRSFEKWGIPNDEILAKCQAKAKEIKNKFPKMKPDRVARKVAEYFKLKKMETADELS